MYTYSCKINKILDGDTIEIDIDLGFYIVLSNQTIRLAGLDTPESRTKNLEEKTRGLLSKKKVSEKLPVGSKQKIQIVKQNDNNDKFGRILGIFILEDNTNLNQWMIDNNYAVSYNGENKELVEEAHQFNRKKLIERGELK